MDRSFLSDASVVAASRNFVCIRLATYEDKKEAEFMKSLYTGRTGELENTTFAILAPDGQERLTATGRAPFHAFRGSSGMAEGMNRIAARYESASSETTDATANERPSRLPVLKDVDLALNVAAADGMPLVVVFAKDAEHANELRQKVNAVAWNDSIIGQFAYATAVEKQDLKPIVGMKETHGILVVQPGQFGLSGKVLSFIDEDASEASMQQQLLDVVAKYPRNKMGHDEHVRLGIQLGIDWQSEIPETDPMSVRARERVRGR